MNGTVSINVNFDLTDDTCENIRDFEYMVDRLVDALRASMRPYWGVNSLEIYVDTMEILSKPCRRCGRHYDEGDMSEIAEYYGDQFCYDCVSHWEEYVEAERELVIQRAKERFEEEGEW